MEWIKSFLDFFLHLDAHLSEMIQSCGIWTYLILFLIVFCETGLVVTPILPGDSLLFAVGAFSAKGDLDIVWVLILLMMAAILGDTVNYWIGAFIGPKIFQQEHTKFFKKEHLEKTHQFYEKYGGKTIVFARFIPIIRTFAPFVAGIGKMSYLHFLVYNIAGGILWILLFVFGGYYFGNLEIVKKNFTLVIFAIIIISIMPAVIEYIRQKRSVQKSKI